MHTGSQVPENGKRAVVYPLDKGEPNCTIERNFRPVSILTVFSKIYEKVLKNQLIPCLVETLSLLIAAYRKSYGTQHVSTIMVEEWRTKLDNDYIVAAIPKDLLKAFDCIPHDTITAEPHAYG